MRIGTEVSFEWPRCRDGHQLVCREVSKDQLERWAAWEKIGKKVGEQHARIPALPDKWLYWLRRRTSDVLSTRPLDHDSRLFRRFAHLDFEPDTYQKFADDFGLLMAGESMSLWSFASFHACLRRALGLEIPQWMLEHVPAPIDLHASLRARGSHDEAAIDLALNGIGNLVLLGLGDRLEPIIRLRLLIEQGCNIGTGQSGVSGRLGLMIRPRNLMVAIALQTIRHLSGEPERTGVKLLQCEHCDTHFEAGPGTQRRTTSRFCSRQCENRSNYSRRMRKERPGPSQGTS